jgi:hypothetical protein
MEEEPRARARRHVGAGEYVACYGTAAPGVSDGY